MPILTLQRQLRELGRIRTGIQVAASGGRKHPSKLETFRLTSSSRDLVAAAAEAYGGTVTPWQNGDRQEFEVVTTAAVLDIVVPPGQPVSQWYELWAAGGCQRRCDGVTNVLDMSPCACPADVAERLELAKDGKACKATTRLNVMLPALPDLGVWRLESHGFYAAVELAGAAEILAMASSTGRLIPARLRLEQRQKKVPGKPTNRYAVPIIEFVETRMADLQLTGSDVPQRPQLVAGRPAPPELPSTTLPPSSDFRAPVADVEEGQVRVEPDWMAGATAADATAEPVVAEPTAAPTSQADVDVATVLRDSAAASAMLGPITEPQKARLGAILSGLRGAGVVTVALDAVFGEGAWRDLSAAQGQALINAADSVGTEAFHAAIRAIAERAKAAA
jgi:hypothetical protein